MWHHSKKTRIIFFSLVASLFLLSGIHSGFSQEELQEISDEDLDLLEEFLEQADDLFDEENYDESIIYYDQVLAIDSSDIDALNGKGLALDTIGKHEEAITYYDMVLAIGSSDIDALNGKALALYNLDKHEEAITYFDAVLAIDSTDDDALFGKALALEGLGKEHEAIPLLEQVIEQAQPEPQFRVPPEGTVNQDESDQILFVIVGIVIAGYVAGFGMMGFFSKSRPKALTNRYDI